MLLLTQLEDRSSPAAATDWYAGWPACRLLGYGVPADALRVYVPDAVIAPRVAAMLSPVAAVAVVTIRPDLPPSRYIEAMETPAGWIDRWAGSPTRGVEGNAYLGVPVAGLMTPRAVYVDRDLPPPQRAVTAAHEVGHAIGLAHVNDPLDLMFGGGTSPASVGLTDLQIAIAERTIAVFERSP